MEPSVEGSGRFIPLTGMGSGAMRTLAPTQTVLDQEQSKTCVSGLFSVSTEIEDEAALWSRYREHADAGARLRLLDRFLPYAKTVAASYYARRTHNDIGFDEYFQLASLAMIESLARFDPGYGVQFKTFAARRMHGALLSGLERLTEKNQQIAVQKRLRQERLQSLSTASGEVVPPRGLSNAVVSRKKAQDDLFDDLAEIGVGIALGILLEGTGMHAESADQPAGTSMSPEISYFRKSELAQLRERLKLLVTRLTTQEQSVIRGHYLQELEFEEISKMLGVTRGRISQIHRQALARLRKLLGNPPNVDIFC